MTLFFGFVLREGGGDGRNSRGLSWRINGFGLRLSNRLTISLW